MKLSDNASNSKKGIIILTVITITIVVLGFLFMKLSQKNPSKTIQMAIQPVDIKIDFNFLEGPVLRGLRIYRLISLPEEGTTSSTSSLSKRQVGRPNPFLPYH